MADPVASAIQMLQQQQQQSAAPQPVAPQDPVSNAIGLLQSGDAAVTPQQTQTQAFAAKPSRASWGDSGSLLSAGEAFNALNTALEHGAYLAGQKVSDYASKILPPEVAGALGFGTNVALQAAPAMVGGEGAAKAAAPIMEKMGQKAMQIALKPPIKDLMNGDAAKAIQTMLDNGISVTEGGVLKLRQKIAELGDQVKNAVANSNAMINKGDVGQRLLSTLDQFKNQVNPQADIAALKQAWLNFRNHPDLIGKQQIPVQTAHELKQGTYRSLGDKPYGELQGASVESQKQLARALREEVAQAVPEVAAPLKQQSALINAADLAERRVLTHGNNQLLGLAPLGITPWSWMAFLADRNPATMSTLGRMLYSGRNAGPALLGQTAGALYGADFLGNPVLLNQQ